MIYNSLGAGLVAKLESAQWPSSIPLTDRYVDLKHLVPQAVPEFKSLEFKSENDLKSLLEPKFVGSKDLKFHALGFQYVGPRIRIEALEAAGVIKEAYGVERDGMQHVIVVMEKAHGVRAANCCLVPYRLKLVSQFILLGTMTLYKKKNNEPFDDPILDAIKAPDENKWIWYSPQQRKPGKKPKRFSIT